MKKLALLSVFLALPLILAGCKTAPAPLAAGAYNTVDAQINAGLQAAHAAVLKYEADVNAGLHTPTVAEKTAINAIISDLNIADPLYQQWHATLQADPTAGAPAQLIAANNAIAAKMTALEALVK